VNSLEPIGIDALPHEKSGSRGEYVLGRRGLWVPPAKERLEAVDLFCGAGGFSIGLEAAGIDVVAAVENDTAAAITYLHNLGSPRGCAVAHVRLEDQERFHKALQRCQRRRHHPFEVVPGDHGWIGHTRLSRDGFGQWSGCGADAGCRGMVFGDARQVTGELVFEALDAAGWVGSVDLVVGGPPCQGISHANAKRSPGDARNSLLIHFVRLADELGASNWIMENVPPLIKDKRFRPLLMGVVDEARDRGYTVCANVIDCVNYGVPQRRRRAIIQGAKAGRPIPHLPIPTNWSLVFDVDGRELHELEETEEPEVLSAQAALF